MKNGQRTVGQSDGRDRTSFAFFAKGIRVCCMSQSLKVLPLFRAGYSDALDPTIKL